MKNSFYIISITALLLLLIEFISMSILKPDHHRFFFRFQNNKFHLTATHPAYKLGDIHLGWTYPSPQNGITTLEPLVIAQSRPTKPIIIATLGGSTTDQNFDSNNWPYWLKESLEEIGYTILLHNAGVAGYNSSKELLKMIRDVLPLKPDIIISLSGINEYFQFVEGHPFTNTFDIRRLQSPPSPLLPNAVTLINSLKSENSKTSLGVYNPNSVAQIWLDNMKSMKAIANIHGIEFIPILQGAFGTADRPITNKEFELMENKSYAYNDKSYTIHYSKIRSQLKEYAFINDFTQFFISNDNYLTDLCHLTTEGNQELGQSISKLVLETKVFKPQF